MTPSFAEYTPEAYYLNTVDRAFNTRKHLMASMSDSPFIHRIYNGLDVRVGWPIITKDIMPVGPVPVIARVEDRAQIITYPPSHRKAKKSWLKRWLGL